MLNYVNFFHIISKHCNVINNAYCGSIFYGRGKYEEKSIVAGIGTEYGFYSSTNNWRHHNFNCLIGFQITFIYTISIHLNSIIKQPYPKSSDNKRSVDTSFMSSSIEVLGYLRYEKIRCTYAIRRHLPSYSSPYLSWKFLSFNRRLE